MHFASKPHCTTPPFCQGIVRGHAKAKARAPQALRGSIFDNRLNDEGAPERYRAQNWMALRASISHSFMALTRDHENGVSQQSLTRFECADSPFGLMPYGIANANLRILPSGCCATPTRNAPSGYTKSHDSGARAIDSL